MRTGNIARLILLQILIESLPDVRGRPNDISTDNVVTDNLAVESGRLLADPQGNQRGDMLL